MPRKIAAFGFWSMCLAAAGVGVSIIGRHLGHELLGTWVGPTVTLSSAGLWLYARVLRRHQG